MCYLSRVKIYFRDKSYIIFAIQTHTSVHKHIYVESTRENLVCCLHLLLFFINVFVVVAFYSANIVAHMCIYVCDCNNAAPAAGNTQNISMQQICVPIAVRQHCLTVCTPTCFCWHFYRFTVKWLMFDEFASKCRSFNINW